MNKTLVALYAMSLAALLAYPSTKASAGELYVSQFVDERVDEALTPVRRVKERASSRFRAFKSKFTSSYQSNSSNQRKTNTPVELPTATAQDVQIEPEISKVRMAPQYEAQIDPSAVGSWKRPNNVSPADWNKIIASVKSASKRTGIPEQLILSLINKESGFNPNAQSKSGAIGLTQLMPSTASTECGLSRDELFDINSNVQCGISYLDKQIHSFQKLDLAIAAYNAGPGAVKRAVAQAGTDDIDSVTALLKPETQPYVRKILGRINYNDDFI
jgi:soluble lytic murein transglycosylase-like protein